MAKLKGFTLDVGYPVYGAKFVNNKTLIVAGGGGEGKNGVPNKITAIVVHPTHPKKPLKRFRELQLNDEEDCPMSLDVNNDVILLGINENSENIKKGVNKHLRKFKYVNDHLRFVESCQIHPGSSPQQYQKITCLSQDGTLGIIAMSDNPSSIYIVDISEDIEEKFKIMAPGDVKDLGISPDGKMMCYITSNHLEAISTITGRSVFKTDIDFHMTKLEFYDDNTVILAGSQKSGIVLARFSIAKSQIVKQATIYRNLKGVTSMDVNQANGLATLAGSDCSLMFVRIKDLKLIKKVNKVHNFAITKVTSSSDGHYVSSVSAANTVSVIVIPKNFADSKPLFLSIFEFLLSIILIGVMGISMQYLYVNGYLDSMKNKVVALYRSHRPADSSSYFTVQPIGKRETFIKGAPSTTTYLPDDATIKSDIISVSSEDSITTVTPVDTSTPVSLVSSKDEPEKLRKNSTLAAKDEVTNPESQTDDINTTSQISQASSQFTTETLKRSDGSVTGLTASFKNDTKAVSSNLTSMESPSSNVTILSTASRTSEPLSSVVLTELTESFTPVSLESLMHTAIMSDNTTTVTPLTKLIGSSDIRQDSTTSLKEETDISGDSNSNDLESTTLAPTDSTVLSEFSRGPVKHSSSSDILSSTTTDTTAGNLTSSYSSSDSVGDEIQELSLTTDLEPKSVSVKISVQRVTTTLSPITLLQTETVKETVHQTVQKTVQETVHQTIQETVQKTVEHTVKETQTETVVSTSVLTQTAVETSLETAFKTVTKQLTVTKKPAAPVIESMSDEPKTISKEKVITKLTAKPAAEKNDDISLSSSKIESSPSTVELSTETKEIKLTSAEPEPVESEPTSINSQ